jgi:hypothetical protein
MFHLKSAPPAAPLLAAIAALERAGLVCALGGSGLLASLGLADRVRDWDLTTDAPLDRLLPLFESRGPEAVGPSGVHADRKLVLDGGVVEIISGFAFRAPGGVVRIPTVVSGRRDGIPIGSPEAWAVAYVLLGRPAKSEALFGWLAAHGADPETVARLRAEPLPAALSARLAAVAKGPPSSDT